MSKETLTRTLRKHYGAYNRLVKIGQIEYLTLDHQPFAYLICHPDGTYEKSETQPRNGKYKC